MQNSLSFMLETELLAVQSKLSLLNEWGVAAASAGLSAGKILVITAEGKSIRHLQIANIRLGPFV